MSAVRSLPDIETYFTSLDNNLRQAVEIINSSNSDDDNSLVRITVNCGIFSSKFLEIHTFHSCSPVPSTSAPIQLL